MNTKPLQSFNTAQTKHQTDREYKFPLHTYIDMENLLKSSKKLEKIGQGFCGTVWSEDSGALVIKRADGGPGRSLPNEDHVHIQVLSAVTRYRAEMKHPKDVEGRDDEKKSEEKKCGNLRPIKVNIPFRVAFLEQTSALWPRILPRLPEGFTACEALISERIPSIPLRVRELLARRYCPSPQQAAQMARDKANSSCLVRPYLGRRRPDPNPKGGPRRRFFSLRNFPLHVDQMEELGLPVDDYATAMADALAFLHWIARVDAGDVEYVLAPPREEVDLDSTPSIGDVVLDSEAFGQHSMWILDFDCCRQLEMSAEGMRRAAMCFWRNDPFYPRPGARKERDQRIWEAFEERFLKVSDDMLRDEGQEVRALPGILISTIRDNRDTWTRSAIN